MDIPFEPIKKSLVGNKILLLALYSIYWIYAMAVLFLLIIKSILHPLLFRFLICCELLEIKWLLFIYLSLSLFYARVLRFFRESVNFFFKQLAISFVLSAGPQT